MLSVTTLSSLGAIGDPASGGDRTLGAFALVLWNMKQGRFQRWAAFSDNDGGATRNGCFDVSDTFQFNCSSSLRK